MPNQQQVDFTCSICGACCKGRYVPLSLGETRAWLDRGHRVAILLEAFAQQDHPADPSQYIYDAGRGAPARSGDLDIYVIAVFAADAILACPHLGENHFCNIYDARPSVCRIYPFEMNPFVAFRKEHKDCPPDAWVASGAHADGHPSDDALAQLIEAARTANVVDAAAKIAVCERLGLAVTAWRGNGYAIHTPEIDEFQAAIRLVDAMAEPAPKRLSWQIQVDGAAITRALCDLKASLFSGDADRHRFISLGGPA